MACPDEGRAWSLGLGIVLFLVFFLGSGRLDDMQGAALDRLGGDLATGFLCLLGAPGQDVGHTFGVLAGIGNDCDGDGQLGIILADCADRQGALRNVDQLTKCDADLLLERVARVFQPGRDVVAEVFQCGIVPELPILALLECLTQGIDVGHLEQENGRVGENTLGGRRGLGEVRRQSGITAQTNPSNQGQAKNRPLRHTHYLTLQFRQSAAHRPWERDSPPAHRADDINGCPGSEPESSPTVTGELVSGL